jgi:hypothetical protein
MSFGRSFQLRERMTFWLRAEFTNIFNRTQIPNPVINGYNTGIATTTLANGTRVNNTGFGAIATRPATAVGGERSGLLVARLTF